MSLTIDPSARKRIDELRTQQNKPGLMLRIRVDGGGCAGFQYRLELSDTPAADEEIFENAVVSDEISLPFLNGATVRFEQSLIGAEFRIDNPNAVSGCGCGTSFSVNQ
ncbi:MAG: iron-sulfur cluster assembly accessory protein [Alphaproteobacteria bacterium]|nr:iron-sulfur cluster assembly accessory protein [Alphaproteobacteria bacterium]